MAEADWQGLLALAVRERAVGPVWRSLDETEIRAMPAVVADRFRALANVAEFRQRRLMARLGESLRALSDAGVEALLLKGAALAQDAYPDPTARPMFDLDVLVPERRAEEARDALLAAGWSWRRGAFPDEMYRHHCHLPPLDDERGIGLVMEIHTDLFVQGHPFRLGADQLEEGAREIRVGTGRARVPGPVWHLVYVCAHFAWSHMISRGAWRTFRDVSVLAGSEDFDWGRLVEAARRSRSGTCCYWTLSLARGLGGVRVPERVLDALRPGLPGVVERLLRRHFALELLGEHGGCPSVHLRRWLWTVGIAPRSSGHGASRPWTHEGDFLQGGVASAGEGASWARLRRGAGRVGRMAHHLRTMALGRRGSDAPAAPGVRKDLPGEAGSG